MRTIRYREIADDLRGRVEGGEFPPGRLLPSEADLSDVLQGEPRDHSPCPGGAARGRRCSTAAKVSGGSWPAVRCARASGRLATIEAQLAASGLKPERRVLEFAFLPAEPRVRRVLGCDQVLRVRRLNLADGEPFALVTVWCPASLAEHLSLVDVERSPFYELLEVPLGGATQTIGAAAAEPADAAKLAIPSGSPVLRCERVTRRRRRRACAAERPHLPGPSHRVRGRPEPGRAEHRAHRASARGVTGWQTAAHVAAQL